MADELAWNRLLNDRREGVHAGERPRSRSTVFERRQPERGRCLADGTSAMKPSARVGSLTRTTFELSMGSVDSSTAEEGLRLLERTYPESPDRAAGTVPSPRDVPGGGNAGDPASGASGSAARAERRVGARLTGPGRLPGPPGAGDRVRTGSKFRPAPGSRPTAGNRSRRDVRHGAASDRRSGPYAHRQAQRLALGAAGPRHPRARRRWRWSSGRASTRPRSSRWWADA